MRNNPAVLIFANTPQNEVLKKGISSIDLFENLNAQVLNTVKKSGLTYFLITEKEQNGRSFGERFTNAIQFVFNQGFDNVITIGNDTPQLSVNHLRKTCQQLKENKIVLGPSVDGGFYLMGISKNLFDKNQFLKLPWQTKRLTKCVERLISKSVEKCYRLEVLRDIDNSKDLKSVLHIFRGISAEIRYIIVCLLKNNFLYFKKEENLKATNYPHCFYNKGSPIFLHY